MQEKGKHVGQVRALTTLSPVIPSMHRRLWLRLLLVRWIPNAGRPLQELAFIHYGRWTVITDLPDHTGAGRTWQLNSRHLLFESNYDGGLSDYLDAFADTIPHRLARLWGTCTDFEPSVMKTRGAAGRDVAPSAFRRYVARNELEVLHFYAAYPDYTVIAVRQALAIPEAGGLGEKLTRIYRDWRSSSRRRYGVSPFTVFTPIEPSRRERLVTHLRNLPKRNGPLRRLTDTHYARFVLVPAELVDLGQERVDRLKTSYLLYTSNHCDTAAEHIRLIQGLGEDADAIWDCCSGYPGHASDEFADWFERHRRDTDYFVAGYPDRTPAEIRELFGARAEAIP